MEPCRNCGWPTSHLCVRTSLRQLRHKLICKRHFESRFFRGDARLQQSCPTLFSTEVIATGVPRRPVDFAMSGPSTASAVHAPITSALEPRTPPRNASVTALSGPSNASAVHAPITSALEPLIHILRSLAGGLAMSNGLVQYILLRSDLLQGLGWSVGALVAQACHAATAVLHIQRDDPLTQQYLADLDSMHKVVLEVPDEEALKKLSEKLKENLIAHKLWIEQPENVATCIALKPYHKEHVKKIVGKFKLYKLSIN